MTNRKQMPHMVIKSYKTRHGAEAFVAKWPSVFMAVKIHELPNINTKIKRFLVIADREAN